MDPTTAAAVINAAMAGKMFPEGAMPETDKAKVEEAAKLVNLAGQAKVVADTVGHGNVPQWPVARAVLVASGMPVDQVDGVAPTADSAQAATAPSPELVAAAGPGTAYNPAPGSVAAGWPQNENGAHVPPAGSDAAAQAQQAPVPATATPVDAGIMHAQARPSRNELWYTHMPCDGQPHYQWMVPHDGMPLPKVGSTVECPNCALQDVPIATSGYVPGEEPQQQASTPSPPSGMQQVADATGVAIEGSSFTDPAGTNFRAEPGGDGPTQVPPAAAADPSAGVQIKSGRWLDANSNEWDIIRHEGGPELEARSVSTGETTVLPAGLLLQPSQSQPATQEQTPSPESAPSSPSPEPAGQDAGDRAQAQQLTVPIDDDEGDEKYGDLLETVTANYTPGVMPVPMELERPPVPMPEDLTQVSDIQARALHSQFNALASRARYLHGLEAAKARACDRVYKFNLKGAMREARQELGKDASVTEVQQLAEDSPLVEPWIVRRDRHADRAEAYKTFLSFYTEDVVVLSRDWTMRAKEEQGS